MKEEKWSVNDLFEVSKRMNFVAVGDKLELGESKSPDMLPIPQATARSAILVAGTVQMAVKTLLHGEA